MSARRTKISERTSHQILRQIESEHLVEGDRLPTETEMLKTYGVGRATLREALRLLEVQGVVRVRSGPGGGPIVGRVSIDDFTSMLRLHLQLRKSTFRQVLESRLAIEPLMARLAADRNDAAAADDAKGLMSIVADAETIDPSDHERLTSNFTAFHDHVLAMSANSVLDLFAASLRGIFEERRTASTVGTAAEVAAAHRAIAEAVLAGRADDAERLMADHMTGFIDTSHDVYSFDIDEGVAWIWP